MPFRYLIIPYFIDKTFYFKDSWNDDENFDENDYLKLKIKKYKFFKY